MFIDTHFNEILNVLTNKDNDLGKFPQILSDAIAVDITDVIDEFKPVNDVIHKCTNRSVVFPDHAWYEWLHKDGSYFGVLSIMPNSDDVRMIKKSFMGLVKAMAKGKIIGSYSKRKPKIALARMMHSLIFIVKDIKKGCFLIGTTTRLLTENYVELGKVQQVPSKEAGAHGVMMDIDVERIFEAQSLLNDPNNTTIKTNLISNYVPNTISQELGISYRVLKVKHNRVVLKHISNTRNIGAKQRYHSRRGHTRRLKQKDGTIKKIWINSYHAGDRSIGEVHKDYKL